MNQPAAMIEIPFSGKLEKSDLRKVNNLATRKMRRIGYPLAVLMALLILPSTCRGVLENPSASNILSSIPLLLIWVAVFWAIPHFSLNRGWSGNPVLHKPSAGSVSEEGITWKVEDVFSSQYRWELLSGYRRSKDLLVVYVGRNQVLYFPRHYFKDDGDWTGFIELVAGKLSKR